MAQTVLDFLAFQYHPVVQVIQVVLKLQLVQGSLVVQLVQRSQHPQLDLLIREIPKPQKDLVVLEDQ